MSREKEAKMRYRYQTLMILKHSPSPEGIVDSNGRHVPMDEVVEMLNELAAIKEKEEKMNPPDRRLPRAERMTTERFKELLNAFDEGLPVQYSGKDFKSLVVRLKEAEELILELAKFPLLHRDLFEKCLEYLK